MATPLDITALETSFDLVAARREELVDRFYRRLFTDAPNVLAFSLFGVGGSGSGGVG